jgi:hypothetical protein
MSTLFTTIAANAQRMQDAQREEVKMALKAGASLISLSRDCPTGGLVLRVTIPTSWHGEPYDRLRYLDLGCVILPEREADVQAWYATHTRKVVA